MEERNGRVFLVGAGCGKADLITLRGLHRLEICEAVVYDDLIDERLLEAAPAEAQRIYVGKRWGKHAMRQEEISRLLVEIARQGKRVVRLKGGDPFVFGRGGEEIQTLQEAGIPYEVIPGISSAVAIPAAAGIPVTHRGVSRSFHVITGHTVSTDGGLPEDLEHLAALNGTLVFLMGLHHVGEITSGLLAAGKDPRTPSAVISGGNARHPAILRTSLAELPQRVSESGICAPAVIVVGAVAALDFSAMQGAGQGNFRVGVSGTELITEKLRLLLEAQGAEVETVGKSLVEPLPASLRETGLCSSGRHWLVFTSGNGVERFFEELRAQKIDLRQFGACRFAVIGPETGRMLERHGFLADLCPNIFTSAALAEELCSRIQPNEDVFLLRSRDGAEILPRRLREKGISVTEVPLYCLQPDLQNPESDRLWAETADYLAFCSASGVRMYFERGGKVAPHTLCVCIGEMTGRALRQYDSKPFLMADTATAEGVVAAILRNRLEKMKMEERKYEDKEK